MSYRQFLDVAREAASEAAEVIRHYYGPVRGQGDDDRLAIEIKQDDSPVTIADREAERVIRSVLLGAFPDHAFYGEETGRSGETQADFEWLVDPIDGTKSFIRRYPFFSTQIGLRHKGRIIVGVSSAPLFGEEAWAALGEGAFLDGERIQVSDVASLRGATLSTGNIASLAADSEAWSRFGSVLQEVSRTRGYGDFYHYHLLARGAIDAVVESDVNILDIAALSLIVEEAGGRFTTLSGGTVDDAIRTVLASNGQLHGAVTGYIGWNAGEN